MTCNKSVEKFQVEKSLCLLFSPPQFRHRVDFDLIILTRNEIEALLEGCEINSGARTLPRKPFPDTIASFAINDILTKLWC